MEKNIVQINVKVIQNINLRMVIQFVLKLDEVNFINGKGMSKNVKV